MCCLSWKRLAHVGGRRTGAEPLLDSLANTDGERLSQAGPFLRQQLACTKPFTFRIATDGHDAFVAARRCGWSIMGIGEVRNCQHEATSRRGKRARAPFGVYRARHLPQRGERLCVLRVKVRGQRDLITMLGSAAEVHAGEHIQASGHWEQHREHGPQFRALFLQVTPPSSREGIERYLASGLIKGIGPHFAKRLVAAFGEAAFDVIETAPRRLLEVVGIGATRLARITAGWADQKAIREIMVFLQGHGVGTARQSASTRPMAPTRIPLVKEDPYRLAALHNRGSIPRGVHASSGVTTPTATSSGPAHIGREYRP